MPSKRALLLCSVALFCFAGLFVLDQQRLVAYLRLRNLIQDTVTRAGRTTPANPNLVFLAIDSDSTSLGSDGVDESFGLTKEDVLESRALRLMGHPWPWPREIYGMILDRLVAAGASAVMFDLVFPEPSEGDAPFHLALDRNQAHVVIGSNFLFAAKRGFTTSAAVHTRPPETLVPQTAPIDDRIGYTNFWPDPDDVVRRAQYRVTFEQIQGLAPTGDSERFLSLGGRALVKARLGSFVPADLDDRVFRYTAPPRQGFPPHSVFEIFVPDYWKHNYRNGKFFRNKIVIVGAEGNWGHDEHPTPFGSMPGPELHLNAINAALHREFLTEMTPLSVTGITALAGLIAIAVSLVVLSPWLRLLALILLNATLAWIALLVYNRYSTCFPCVGPLAEMNLTVVLGLICDFTWERREKKRVRRTLEKYVSKNVVRELLENPKAYAQSLGGVVKPATILFSDIRGYSTVSARTDPQALVAQLNEYLTAMVDCVFQFHGTLDKFIGDAVMAVWGNTHSEGVRNDAINAVRAALAMRSELARLNRSWRERGLPELRIGIAINHGEVVVGNIGSPQRMEFTVIGDAVNVSWKLQELTKELGVDLIVGRNVAPLIVEEFDLRSLGEATIRGTDAPAEVFAVTAPVEIRAGA
jgi:adenylate cyclase